MKKLYLLLFLTISIQIFPQYNPNGGKITGKVFDNDSKHSIEYANIVLLSTIDSSLINGTITNADGLFDLSGIKPGKYLVDVRFIGYKSVSFNVDINPNNRFVDLGDIFIKPDALELNDVVVQGERSPVSYQIDKKVIDVDKIQTVISGNAADVLQNVPSVTVDIEGNVSLRGSSNFTVLIDGKPSIISAQDALQQIPASSIQNIEIITNPSAKYDPEGTAGIINILLKKNENLGLSGIVNANAGLNEKYGGDFLFQYRTNDLNYIFGLDYNKRMFPGSSNAENRYISTNSTSYLNSNGNSEWGRIGFGIRAGLEYNFSQSDFVNLNLRFGTREGSQNSTLNYNSWSSNSSTIEYYRNISERSRDGKFGGTNLTYIHNFGTKGHEIKSEFNFRYNDGDESTLTESLNDTKIFDGKKTTELGPSRDFETKIDYTLPLSDTRKFEAGYQNEIENSDEISELYFLDSLTNQYQYQSLFSNSVKYKNNDQAFYATYTDEFGNFGIQGGLRTEYTYRTIALLNLNKDFTIDRWDFFPTLHTSYKFSEGTQMMASYTRRIQRPNGWQLEPFLTWTDANNVRVGNPDLLPELIDSYETGVQTYIGKVSLSAELYHRVTNNKIDRIRSLYTEAENVNLNSVSNIGKDFSTGSELMLIFDPIDFWNVNLMANFYNYRIKGVMFNESFERESFNWNTRFNNMFKISPNTQFQFNVNYNSPGVSSQGSWEGFFTTDVSVKQDLFEKLLSLTLQVRDLFGTAKHEFTSSGQDFYSYNYFKRESPMVILNMRINFNNFKPKRNPDDMENMNNGGEEF
ncbi:MAG TPA: outer membrane beta-barrel family protein [Ignavibacteriaceae bacterium]